MQHALRLRPQGVCAFNGETRTCTGDTGIFNAVLYQLSYLAVGDSPAYPMVAPAVNVSAADVLHGQRALEILASVGQAGELAAPASQGV